MTKQIVAITYSDGTKQAITTETVILVEPAINLISLQHDGGVRQFSYSSVTSKLSPFTDRVKQLFNLN